MMENEKAVTSSLTLELDPLLKDFNEKKLSFRRNVVSLTAALKDSRSRLAKQDEFLVRESQSRQVAESKARNLEEVICRLHECLNERNDQFRACTLVSEQCSKDLDILRSQLSLTHATAEVTASSAQSALAQCLSLVGEVDEKSRCIRENEVQIISLCERLDQLQRDLEEREMSQNQLKEHVLKIDKEIQCALAEAGDNRDYELRKVLDEDFARNFEKMNKFFTSMGDEIARLRDEVHFLSAHLKHKNKEFESQLEKHRRADQEVKKKVLKLEFCLQETRSQIRKLQRMGEKSDRAIKELREQIEIKQQRGFSYRKFNFWESSGIKVIASMSMLILVAIARG
ncbi:hypothetical protein AXF42_Ash003782 [Apostasia shenzhenica]|uniref:Uncharacterized protein n=1 Tax=Apostasia shenzhenica TaxID=1088818 RepID=A0A2I0AHZ8_9ASPA|nr:hypothetical protein AXF42_Ash003782 [Apostasia shenzhenica]